VNAVKESSSHVRNTSGNISIGSQGTRPSDLTLDKSEAGHAASELSPDLYKSQQSASTSGLNSPIEGSRESRQASDTTRLGRSLNELVALDKERTAKRDPSASNLTKALESEAPPASSSRKPSGLEGTVAPMNTTSNSQSDKSHPPDGTNHVIQAKSDPPKISTDVSTNKASIPSSTVASSNQDHSSNPSLADRPPRPGKLAPRVSQSRLPGFRLSRASSSDTSAGILGSVPIATSHIRFNQDVDGVGGHGEPTRTRTAESQAPPHVMSQIRSKVLSKDFWMRDENAKDCFNCGEPFSTFRRKHHCRKFGTRACRSVRLTSEHRHLWPNIRCQLYIFSIWCSVWPKRLSSGL
jgi:1-phosphatidylinositol-3-phosphate 5-kinase